MKNSELEKEVNIHLQYGHVSRSSELIFNKLIKEIERLENRESDISLLRAKIASEQLAGLHVGEPRFYIEDDTNKAFMVAHAITMADMLIEALKK